MGLSTLNVTNWQFNQENLAQPFQRKVNKNVIMTTVNTVSAY